MPIRFRCAYCNQLMGISRRKAGKVVRCPKCAGEIIVPVPEGMDAPDPPESPAEQAAGPAAFEDKNFEQALNAAPQPTPERPSATVPTEPAPLPDVPVPTPAAPPKRLGLFLPLGMLIVSLGVIVLLLILMFVLGLIIGRHTMITDKTTALRLAPAAHDREQRGIARARNEEGRPIISSNVRSSPATSRSPSAAPDLARNSCRA